MRLDAGQYLPDQHKKNLIVLHFTAGSSCESAFRTWNANPDRIATAYGVDPEGSIVEFFPPECWAYHLGIKGTSKHDHRSIGIEIANVGPLKLAPGNPAVLNWWPKNWGTRFCDIAETGRYRRAAYRGIDYFATMPEIQQQSVGILVRELCERFSIPRQASLAARNGEFDPKAFDTYAGVATHTNFRRDKWDVGPAFNWENLGF
ncbi:MAG: N-acetylmuramoyl-L-alanine amidase [Bryobacterales bacterium]|nr:N-acetylmuramoyl-L-alanine amidase [Bryobacterales bacterium]